MDLKSARAARNAGDYDRALRLYRCVPAHERTAEPYDCLLELAIARRVVDDLMTELNWEPCRNRSFDHLEGTALPQANTAGLRDAFVALRAGGRADALSTASIADELFDSCASSGKGLQELEELGLSITGGVRLAAGRAYRREGRLDAAIEQLRALVAEFPSQVVGWDELTVSLLQRGSAAEAMMSAHFATRLSRNRANLYGGHSEQILRYRGYEIFFGGGLFVALRPLTAWAYVADRGNPVIETGNSTPGVWRRLSRRISRSLRFRLRRLRFRLKRLRQIIDWKISGAKSKDLLELMAMLDRRGLGRLGRRS